MKCFFRVIGIGVVFLIGSFDLKAQRGFFIGGEVMPQNTWLLNRDDRSSEVIDQKFTLRGAGGLSVTYFPTDNFGVGLRALYSIQGQSYEIKYAFRTETMNRITSYLKFPVLIHYRTGDISDIYFTVLAGAEVNLVQSANHRQNGNIVEPDEGVELLDMYRKPTFGGVLAFGPGFGIKRNVQFEVQLRFDHGVTNAEEKASVLVENTREETYNFTAGLRFALIYEFGSKFNTNKGGYL